MRKAALALLLTACAPAAAPTAQPTPPPAPATVHVYTSLYREVVDAVAPAVDARIAKTMPGVKVDWFQGGSEKVATRLDGELSAGTSPADILLTSDPAYYRKLKSAGKLIAYDSPEASREPAVDLGLAGRERLEGGARGLRRDPLARRAESHRRPRLHARR